ncbi:MAG: hypothetical protein JNL83_30700 [Myxococcales bacterium]|nr:hypothetical protein [Myxococcales bacterium]
MKTRLSLVLLLVAAAACGGKKTAPATASKAPMGGGDHHANMLPEVHNFHEVLAPRWHADKGPKRMADTCGAMAEFQSNADALTKVAPPATTDAAAWGTKTQDLVTAVGALDGTCKANDATAFEPAFERVHTSFHSVMEASAPAGAMKHDQHGGHGEHHDHKM